MGSFSVYCGLSNISITASNQCCVLPLLKTKYNQSHKYLPATLPIWGEYDDYGNITGNTIIEDENTKLIEEHFGCTIYEFVEYIVREKRWGRTGLDSSKFKNFNELEQYEFMFIDKQVYDFLSTFKGTAFGTHEIELGNSNILTYFGFKDLNQKVKGTDEYEYDVWEYDNKLFYTRHGYLYTDTPDTEPLSELITFYGSGNHSNLHELSKYVTLNEIMLKHIDSSTLNLWFVLNKPKKVRLLLRYLETCYDEYGLLEDEALILFMQKIGCKSNKIEEKPSKVILQEYAKNIDKFGNEFAKLSKLFYNIHCYSMTLKPHIECVTPQCGEYEDHQRILEEFYKINKSYIYVDEDMEDEGED